MKKLIYTLALALAGTFAQAQVKIGANPGSIGTNSNLEVEATNGSKTVIRKDNGNMGIGTQSPATKLEISSGSANTSGLRLSDLNSTTPPFSGTTATLGVNQNGDVVVVNGVTGTNTGTTQVMRIGFNYQTMPGNSTTPYRFYQANSAAEMGTNYFGGQNYINTIIGSSFQESIAIPAGSGTRARTTDRIFIPAGVYKISIGIEGTFSGNSSANYLGVQVNVDNTIYTGIPISNIDYFENTGAFATTLLELTVGRYIDFEGYCQYFSFSVNNPTSGAASPKIYNSTIMIEKLL